ncbi:hypothetical protein HanXRQr2_Chr04g0159951 [Helianthus annuus]|uniref:Uncharacterized protein n=1 Tax=Helianthus annuus TaxID=4232 RepID=A0A9K3J729_HELAN|nr:hypothetical protein HanXRQr2_Chr04g0159951 [Helianthus annuus]KAJ0930830.1 hypothetical protein HanPSC8_Chr04g0154041 [Helianthus annuus]
MFFTSNDFLMKDVTIRMLMEEHSNKKINVATESCTAKHNCKQVNIY